MAVPARRLRPATGARGAPTRTGVQAGRRRADGAPLATRSAPARRARRAPRTPARPARVPFLIMAAVVVGSMVMGLVSMQALVAQRSFDVQELERRAHELATDHGRLRLELAELSDPGRIEAAAHRAGLVLGEDTQVLEVPAWVAPAPGRAVARLDAPAAAKLALGAGG